MRVEKFTGSDMRQAMANVREALGSDAVIISSKRVNDMTEITAAMNYDPKVPESVRMVAEIRSDKYVPVPPKEDMTPAIVEIQDELGRLRQLFEGELAQLAWRDMSKRQPNRFALIQRLEMCGIKRTLAEKMVDRVLPCDNLEQGWRKTLGMIGGSITTYKPDILEEGGVIALLGSTGVGKTITAAKLAARFALRHGRRQVAFISTDKYKVGGQEQLVSFGSILGIPVQMVANAEEMQRTLESLSERKLVIIDTAGMSQRDMSLADQFQTLSAVSRIQPMLVLPATARESIINETIKAFSKVNLAAAIITKTDEGDALGPILSCVLEHNLPLSFITNGQKVPEDLHVAEPKLLLAEIIRSYKQQQKLQEFPAAAMSIH
ncbi:MAG: flagellar biosynthesis protein FlhF [Pseudomonadota bacterium]